MADDTPAIDELAALLAIDALAADEQADAELRHGTFPAGLTDVVAALADAAEQRPPDALRAATLRTALTRRPGGTPIGAAPSCPPAEAYARTVAEFDQLLTELTPDEWQAPAHAAHGTVRQLVAHLTGVERLCRAWLDPDAAPPVDPHLDHVASTRQVVDEFADVDARDVATAWHDAAIGVSTQAAAGDPNRAVSFHDITTSVDGLLVMRTFELWAHGMDIAFATGRPMPVLDDARMALMSSRLMAALPLALAYRTGSVAQGTVRFVLTGDAGGVYTVPLDMTAPGSQQPDVTIVTDVVDLCRVAARRLPAAELAASITGDRTLATAVLAGVDAFARD
jgi:uncharacterized protein (TIGR03083 family)